jgi:translation initiation factor 4E
VTGDVTPEEATDAESPELLIKHPLQNVWALWYFKNDKRNNWLDNQKIITTFSTVEDFWA